MNKNSEYVPSQKLIGHYRRKFHGNVYSFSVYRQSESKITAVMDNAMGSYIGTSHWDGQGEFNINMGIGYAIARAFKKFLIQQTQEYESRIKFYVDRMNANSKKIENYDRKYGLNRNARTDTNYKTKRYKVVIE